MPPKTVVPLDLRQAEGGFLDGGEQGCGEDIHMCPRLVLPPPVNASVVAVISEVLSRRSSCPSLSPVSAASDCAVLSAVLSSSASTYDCNSDECPHLIH